MLESITKDKKKKLEITMNEKCLILVKKKKMNVDYRDTSNLEGFKF